MSLQVVDTAGNVVSVRLSGRLSEKELVAFHQSVPELLRKHGDFNLLVLAEEFTGIGEGNWSATSPQTRYDSQIRRIAIVCDEKWADQVRMFAGQGLRAAQIECFAPADLAKAKAWLNTP